NVYVSTFPFMGLHPIPAAVGKPFTVFAMVGLINAINHSDGLDGLAGGESLLSFGCIAYLAYAAGGLDLVTIAVATIGGVFGFLRFNSHPARVFMGDGGSQFLGFTLGYLTVLLTQYVNSALSPALPALILGLPIMDILAVLYLRASHGQNLFRATKNHVHHRLLMLGFDHYGAVVIIYSVQAFFVVSAVFLRYQSDLAVLGVYLGTCALLFLGLTIAEKRGWQVGHVGQPGPVGQLIVHAKAHGYVAKVPSVLIGILVPSYLLGMSIAIGQVPEDFAVGALALFGVLMVSLVLKERPQALQHRIVVYVTAAFVVYLSGKTHLLNAHSLEVFDVAYYLTVAASLALAIRYTFDGLFTLTPMDYLVALGVLLVGAASGGNLAGSAAAPMLVKVIILFYAAEWLISRETRRWNGLFLSVMGALLLLGVRGLM
ncbi:MAG: MraY family glycosyltransferase, partial [Gammaproteobacteria bacterium]